MFRKSIIYIGIWAFSATLAVFSGCDNSVDFKNTPPSGLTITKDLCYLAPGGVVTLCGEAEDADGDSLLYSWSAASGTMIPSSGEGACIDWEAPGTPGVYTVVLKVTDRIDESTASTEIEVGEELFIQPGFTELSNSDSYYIVSKDFQVRVLNGTTLRINKGVKLVFVNRYGGLQIEGRLEVLGTAADPVVFTAAECEEDEGLWQGITFKGSFSEGILKHAIISSAVEGINVIEGASVEMDTCSVVYGIGRGVTAYQASNLDINRCKIWENSGGLSITDSYARIVDSSIRYNTMYGIYLQGTAASLLDFEITSSTIANNYGDGFLLLGLSNPVINGNAIFLNESESGTGYNIKLYLHSADVTIDATGNYWGYLNAQDISETIRDGAADPNFDSVVDFSGWLSTSPTEW